MRVVGVVLVATLCTAPRLAAAKERWIGVTAGRSCAQVVVAWSERRVHVSSDDGRRFVASPHAGVIDAAVTKDCAVVLLRDGRIGEWRDGGEPTWRRPTFYPTRLIADDDFWVALGSPLDREGKPDFGGTVAVSRDAGRTWSLRDFPHLGNDGTQIAVDPDGLVLFESKNDSEHGSGLQYQFRATAAVPVWQSIGRFEDCALWWWGVRGWAYAVSTCAGSRPRLTAKDPAGELIPIAGVAAKPRERFFTVTNGRSVVAVHGRRLFRLEGARATPLPGGAPARLSWWALDGRDRLLGVADGRPARFTPGRGWAPLFP